MLQCTKAEGIGTVQSAIAQHPVAAQTALVVYSGVGHAGGAFSIPKDEVLLQILPIHFAQLCPRST